MHRLHWGREKLIKYQEKKMKKIIRNAYEHVPFYRRKFKDLDLKPEKIKSLDDLCKLPIVQKDELKNTNHENLYQQDSLLMN